MAMELTDWLRAISKYPVKYKFDGLEGDLDRRSSGFFKTAAEAAAASSSFIDKAVDADQASHEKSLKEAIKDPNTNVDGALDRYCDYLENKVSARKWRASGCIHLQMESWSDDFVGAGVPVANLLKIIECFSSPEHIAEFIAQQAMAPDDYQTWLVDEDNEEWVLKEHPAIEVYSPVREEGVPLEDVLFMCPSCGREPHTLAEVNNEGHWYCGLCGAEQVEGDNIEDVIKALGIIKYPFRSSIEPTV